MPRIVLLREFLFVVGRGVVTSIHEELDQEPASRRPGDEVLPDDVDAELFISFEGVCIFAYVSITLAEPYQSDAPVVRQLQVGKETETEKQACAQE